MKKSGLFVMIWIILALFVTGCWSRKELNELSIAVGIGIDKSGDQYKVSVQVAEPNEVTGKLGGGSAPVTLFQATGETILEAIRKLTTVNPRLVYFAHLRVLVLGESLAKEGISSALELLSRDPETRNDFLIVVSKECSAEDTMKVLTNLDKVPASSLFSTLNTSHDKWASTRKVTMFQLISELVSDGTNPVLTGIQIFGDVEFGQSQENINIIDSPTDMRYTNLGVFKKDKLIGWLTENEGIAYNYIANEISSTVSNVSCPDGGRLALKVIRSDTKVKGSMHNGRPRIDIEVYPQSNVGEIQCRLNLTKSKTITELEGLENRRLEELIEKTIARVQQEYKVDIFGFGEVIHRSNPKEWRKLKEDWNHTFSTLSVHVKVRSKINYLGKISNSFLNDVKE
ncbi:Ger(x)C family spore germination protein [Paenibacillus sp. CMAA1364]